MTTEEIRKKILKLKEERNAIILSHNYQLPEIQDIADYVEDSLGLSQKAAQSDADVIVFCGVMFMAETAAILCPEKKVLMPDASAGCPLANMITADKLKALKAKHPDAATVAYVNTNADVKAEVDVCCTSTNAIKVVESANSEEVIFIPDKYLGHYVSTKVKKKLILWNGYCPTHVKILPEDVTKLKDAHPNAKVIVHPECTPAVIALADRVSSTGGMCRFARESDAAEIIVGTEVGIIHRLKEEAPSKRFYAASELAVCPNMKKTTLDKVLWALEEMKHEIKVPEDVSARARGAIERMLAVTG